MTGHAVARLVEQAEAQAYLDLFRAAPKELDFRSYEFDAATILVAPRVDIPLFNRAIGLGLTAPPTEAAVQAMVTIFKEAGVRNFSLQVSPPILNAEVNEWLAGEHLGVTDRWAKVFRSRDEPPVIASDFRVEPIGEEFAAPFAQVACEGFQLPAVLSPWLESSVGRPGWVHYLAWDGLTPVATAALFVRQGIGWLGVATTLPAYRRRGAQGALLAARIRHGVALGCDWFVTETGEDAPERPNPSYHNMLRTGFALAYHRPNYMDTRR